MGTFRGKRWWQLGRPHPLLGKHPSTETIQKISTANRGKKHTEEAKAKISDYHKAHSNSGQFPKGHTPWIKGKRGIIENPNKGKHFPPEFGIKLSQSLKGRPAWNKGLNKEQDVRVNKYAIGLAGRIFSSETRAKISMVQKRRLEDPENRLIGPKNGMYGRKHTESCKAIIGEKSRTKWQDPRYFKMMMEKFHSKPNNLELLFDGWLKETFPGEWQYVGDGRNKSFIVGGRCPDWGHVNGQKKLIELFGDYWHQGENPQEKIDHYSHYGFDTLVIWEHDLVNKKAVLDRISEFTLCFKEV